MEWLFGNVAGVPRWMAIAGAVAVFLIVNKLRASKAQTPPDGGMPVMTHTAGRQRDYRTSTARRRAA